MSRKSTTAIIQKKHCKVCQDAGKTEAEYTSHFTRETADPTSRVICPTLLAQECRFCFKKGHTVKYCKRAKESNDRKLHQHNPKPAAIQSTKKQQPIVTNSFAAAFDSEDESSDNENQDQDQVIKEEEFPTLPHLTRTTSVSVKQEQDTISYARIIPGTYEQIIAEKEQKQKLAKEQRDKKEIVAAVSVIQQPIPIKSVNNNTGRTFKYATLMRSWADSDSESDGEDIPRKQPVQQQPVQQQPVQVVDNDEW
jgi:hypothetical protein